MKKTYINPAMITVHIASKMMIAVSGPQAITDAAIQDAGMDVKEQIITTPNLWDSEW